MKFIGFVFLTLLLSGCQTTEKTYKAPYPTAISTPQSVVQTPQEPFEPVVQRIAPEQPSPQPPLGTGAPVPPPRGCIELRQRGGVC